MSATTPRQHKRAPRGQRATCSVDGCTGIAAGRGYCNTHYQRWRKYGDPTHLRVRRSRVRWTEHDLWLLDDLVSQGLSDAAIAKRFKTTVAGIQLARKRHGITPRTRQLLNCRKIAAQMGIGCSKTVASWIRNGWLRCVRTMPRGKNRQYLVLEVDFLTFLEDPDHWHCWNPERITDHNLRQWATEMRGGVRFLTLSQVADRFYVEPKTVYQWIEKGWLPAVRNGNHLIRESDLEGWVPPSQRSRTRLAKLEHAVAIGDAVSESLPVPAGVSWRSVRVLREAVVV